jgi:putative acetyltransferase
MRNTGGDRKTHLACRVPGYPSRIGLHLMHRHSMKKIEIRRARPQDAESFCAIFGQDSVLSGTLQLPFPSIEKWRERLGVQDANVMLVAEVDQQVVGNAGLHPEVGRRRMHAATIGMSVHHDWQNQKVGTALMAALVDMADNFMQLQRLELTVFADNQRAIALYRKFGFEQEGYMRSFAMRQGQLIDGLMMARVKTPISGA